MKNEEEYKELLMEILQNHKLVLVAKIKDKYYVAGFKEGRIMTIFKIRQKGENITEIVSNKIKERIKKY